MLVDTVNKDDGLKKTFLNDNEMESTMCNTVGRYCSPAAFIDCSLALSFPVTQLPAAACTRAHC